MEKLESPRELVAITVDEVRLFMVTGVAAMVGMAALGLAEWRAARVAESQSREALQQAPADQKAAADRAYQETWGNRMDEECGLTPAEEDQLPDVEAELRRQGKIL